MAEDAIELDYEEEMGEDKTEQETTELPARYKRQKPPSIFSEEYKKSKKDPSNQTESPSTIAKKTEEPTKRVGLFASGRISVGRQDQDKNVDNTKYNDAEEEEVQEKAVADSDSEDDDHFRNTSPTTKTYFPNFPVNRAAVKEELRVTDQHLRDTIVVEGVENLSPYAILKVFTKYNPVQLNPINNRSCLIQFEERRDPLKMMVEMSKSLTTVLHRFTEHSKNSVEIVRDDEKNEEEDPEEGEISDDEGEVMELGLVKNYIYKIGYPDIRQTAHVVYINSGKYSIADNNYRVVTAHVPKRRAILVRFATDGETFNNPEKAIVLRRKAKDASGSEFWTKAQRKDGLNIFDKDGNELEWDFQHDTRFFEDDSGKKEPDEKEWQKPALQVGIKGAVKVRGRGAKRFLGDDSETMNMDKDEPKTKTTRNDDLNWRSASGSAGFS